MPKQKQVAKVTKVVAKQEAPAPSFSVTKGKEWIQYPYDEFERGLLNDKNILYFVYHSRPVFKVKCP